MTNWTDSRGRPVRAMGRGRVEYAPMKPQGEDAQIVVISSNPALHVPNFDKCRRDAFCRCRTCKPALVGARG